MKRLILLFISAFSLAAQTTQVTQSVLGPDGQPANGRVSIQISQACKSGSNYVGMKPINATVTSGVFSINLVPNDSCVPAGTSYAVTWQLTGGNGWTETWVVPTSSSPVTVDSVVASAAPTSSFIIQWQQMGSNGAAIGDAPIWNGTSWIPGVPVGSAPVPTVFGRVGPIVAEAGDYAAFYQGLIAGAPGTWPAFATVATSGAYSSLSGLPTIPSTTTQISEGSNLYFTSVRAIAALAGLYQTPITGAPGTWPTFATVATSGNYNDLSNKPTIAGQVNSDWNAVSGSAQILDKPTIPSTTTQISEGTNLYFTNLRAQTALSGLYQTPLGFTPENVTNKGAASGYAALDGSLNVLGAGFIGSGTGAGAFEMTQGAAQTPAANSVGLQAPASVPTAFNITLWGVPAVGVLHANSLNVLAPSLILTSDLDPSMPAVDTSGSYTDLLNQPTIPAAITGANPTVTAGVGGVTANYLVARAITNPVTYVATGAGGCGSGVAASTAAASATFQLYSVAGTMLSMVADNTVTAGDVVIGGSVIPGRVADSGFSARGSVGSTVCTVGIAQTSAVAGGAVQVLFDGAGNYGTAVSYANVSGTPTIPGPSIVLPVVDGAAAIGVSANYALADHVHPTDTSRAPLASPAFTGTPTAPTQTAGDTSTDIATDAFAAAAATAAVSSLGTVVTPTTLSNGTLPATLTQVSVGGSSATDSASLGSELTSSSGWTSTGWTGSYNSFTSAPSNVSPLTTSLVWAGVNTLYRVVLTYSSVTAGSVSVSMGGSVLNATSGSTNATETYDGPRISNTAAVFTITPLATWSGTVAISIKQIMPIAQYALATKDSLGNINLGLSQQLASNANLFLGTTSGLFNLTGTDNIGIGAGTLANTTTGASNVAIGYSALTHSTKGVQNTGVGMSVLASSIGNSNAAFGYQALYSNTVSNNSAFGNQSLQSDTTGNNNTALGYLSLFSNTTGTSNVALGYQTGYGTSATNANVSGSDNTWIGYEAAPGTTTQYTFQTVIGALATGSCSACVVLGRSAGSDTVTIPGPASHTYAPAASTPSLSLNGAWYVIGNATTSKPMLLIEPAGTASTNWQTVGTGLGINAASGFTGNLVDFQVAAVDQFKIGAGGLVTTVNGYVGTGIKSAAATMLSIQNIGQTGAGTNVTIGAGTITNSAGLAISTAISPTYNQTSSASATDFLVNRTETAVGSGAQYFADFQVAGVSKAHIDHAGFLQRPAEMSIGTKPTITGCGTVVTQTGGASAGTFVSNAVSCAATLTFAQTAANGWYCGANDLTTNADSVHEISTTTTTAVLSGTTVSGDVINFGCTAY